MQTTPARKRKNGGSTVSRNVGNKLQIKTASYLDDIFSYLEYNVKVKVKFTLEQTTEAFNLGARWGGCSAPRPGRFTPGKDSVSFV